MHAECCVFNIPAFGMGYWGSTNFYVLLDSRAVLILAKRMPYQQCLTHLWALVAKQESSFLSKIAFLSRACIYFISGWFFFSSVMFEGMIALMALPHVELWAYCSIAHWSQVSVMREINLFESLCLYRNLAACQLFSFNVLCVAHRQAGMLLCSSLFWSLSLAANILLWILKWRETILCIWCPIIASYANKHKVWLSYLLGEIFFTFMTLSVVVYIKHT